MFGVLNINKPLQCTSHDVVAKVRKILGIRKVGHCGTLDPLAQGVLPVCVGQATRLIEYFPGDKVYRAWVMFGRVTATWDAEGETLAVHNANHLTVELIKAQLAAFQGVIQQQVPPHAAVHVNGKKLYEYARRGMAVELPVREATIYRIELIAFQYAGEAHPVAEVEIHCASGTYVRSIAQALGQAVGTGAFLSGLVRTRHGHFGIEQSVTLETLSAAKNPEVYLLDPLPYLDLPKVEISQDQAQKLIHGRKIRLEDTSVKICKNKLYALLFQQQLVAVAIAEQQAQLKPCKVFGLEKTLSSLQSS